MIKTYRQKLIESLRIEAAACKTAFASPEFALLGRKFAAAAQEIERLQQAEDLLRRCHDDPGIAYTDEETAAMNQLWKDVTVYFSSEPETPK